MKVKIQKNVIEVKEAKDFKTRLLGFMGQKNIQTGILFPNCKSIHTFFMKENIDVIMCNKDNEILFYFPNIGKNKVILPKKDVSKVIELPCNYFNIKIKEKLFFK